MFIGRDKEIKELRKLIKSKKAKLGIVYGRRKIEKTKLIRHSFLDQKILCIEGLENQGKKKQIKNFLFQLSIFSRKKYKISQIQNWRAIFHLAFQEFKDSGGVLCLWVC